MAPKSKKITSKTDPKTEAGNHPKMDQKWRPNGAQMEPKRHPKINDFLARFSDPSGNIDGTARELRGSRGRHTFSSGPPRAAPYYQRLLYNNKQRRVAYRMTERAPLGRMSLQVRSGAIKRGKFERGWQVHAVDLTRPVYVGDFLFYVGG